MMQCSNCSVLNVKAFSQSGYPQNQDFNLVLTNHNIGQVYIEMENSSYLSRKNIPTI